MRKLFLFLVLGLSLLSQSLTDFRYTIFLTETGSTLVTFQQPSSGAKQVYFDVGNTVYCAMTCVVEVLRDSTTAATMTAASMYIVPTHSAAPSPTLKVFDSSDAEGGTVIYLHHLTGGQTLTLPIDTFNLNGANPKHALHITADQDFEVFARWLEK